MGRQVISVGSAPNDHTGDDLRTASQKSNANFSELYARRPPLTEDTSLYVRTPPVSVTISNAAPAVCGWAGHGLVAGKAVIFSRRPQRRVVELTIATPCVANCRDADRYGNTGLVVPHGFLAGQPIRFRSRGNLPPEVTKLTQLYSVIAAGLTPTEFQFSETPGGAAVNTSGTQTPVNDASILPDTIFPRWAHGVYPHFVERVSTVPAGVERGKVHYVIAAGLGADVFQFSETLGGAPVNTTSDQAGEVLACTGDDANDGLASDAAHALLTMQHGVDIVAGSDLTSYKMDLLCSVGDYGEEIALRDYLGGVPDPLETGADPGDSVAGSARASIRSQDPTQPCSVTLRGKNPSVDFRLVRTSGMTSRWFVDDFRAEPADFQDFFAIFDNEMLAIGNIELAEGGNTYALWVPNRGKAMFQRGANSGSSITFTGGPWWVLISAENQSHIKIWEHCYIEYLADVDMGIFVEAYNDAAIVIYRQDQIATHGHAVTSFGRLGLYKATIDISLNSGGDVSMSAIPGNGPPFLNGGACFYNGARVISADNTNTPREKTADYTLRHGDGAQEVRVNFATGKTVTLPKNFPPGWGCWVLQEGAGQLTFAPESGATMQGKGGATKSSAQYGRVWCSVRSNSDAMDAADWRISGDITA
jgi:hypothetical protein